MDARMLTNHKTQQIWVGTIHDSAGHASFCYGLLENKTMQDGIMANPRVVPIIELVGDDRDIVVLARQVATYVQTAIRNRGIGASALVTTDCFVRCGFIHMPGRTPLGFRQLTPKQEAKFFEEYLKGSNHPYALSTDTIIGREKDA